MSSWSSYPSIFNLGHRAVSHLLDTTVNIEEKVDGSQFSFGLIEDKDSPGVYNLSVRSKGAIMYIEAPEKMFQHAVDTVKELEPLLHPGWTYRAEYLAKPKHNTLNYSRIPYKHLILFDVTTGDNEFLSYDDKQDEAARIGLEVVPLLFTGIPNLDDIRKLLEAESILGGQLIEGVVIKPFDYNIYGVDKKVLMGKFVSEAFKEIHSASWKEANPSRTDVIEVLANEFRTPARWNKAIMHLKEQGLIEDDPRDIGKILKEVVTDIGSDSMEEMKDRLFKYAWPQIKRKLTAGLPEWYKDELLKKQFNQCEEIVTNG